MTILEALAHGPASRYELSFLVGQHPEEIADAIFDRLDPNRLVDAETMRNGVFVWCITDAGRSELAHLSARRRDRECTGVGVGHE